jgi:hypothetical protein
MDFPVPDHVRTGNRELPNNGLRSEDFRELRVKKMAAKGPETDAAGPVDGRT